MTRTLRKRILMVEDYAVNLEPATVRGAQGYDVLRARTPEEERTMVTRLLGTGKRT
ncbi:MAG TPA: hypothetical protein VKB63_06920 [Gemmatimonadales bacterium]|nr:hypothetical protein [Gemmatimonadales bacterium]